MHGSSIADALERAANVLAAGKPTAVIMKAGMRRTENDEDHIDPEVEESIPLDTSSEEALKDSVCEILEGNHCRHVSKDNAIYWSELEHAGYDDEWENENYGPPVDWQPAELSTQRVVWFKDCPPELLAQLRRIYEDAIGDVKTGDVWSLKDMPKSTTAAVDEDTLKECGFCGQYYDSEDGDCPRH